MMIEILKMKRESPKKFKFTWKSEPHHWYLIEIGILYWAFRFFLQLNKEEMKFSGAER